MEIAEAAAGIGNIAKGASAITEVFKPAIPYAESAGAATEKAGALGFLKGINRKEPGGIFRGLLQFSQSEGEQRVGQNPFLPKQENPDAAVDQKKENLKSSIKEKQAQERNQGQNSEEKEKSDLKAEVGLLKTAVERLSLENQQLKTELKQTRQLAQEAVNNVSELRRLTGQQKKEIIETIAQQTNAKQLQSEVAAQMRHRDLKTDIHEIKEAQQHL